MRRKKSKFWLFCFSWIPGAGEMYLGFMKMGVSLMGIFGGLCFLATFLDLGPLLVFNVIVWFYSFFHAHNLENMPDEEFHSLKDDYLFKFNLGLIEEIKLSRKIRSIIAWILIIYGIYWISGNILDLFSIYHGDLFYGYIRGYLWEIRRLVPQLIIGVGIIYIGVQLIRGKSKNIEETGNKEDENNE